MRIKYLFDLLSSKRAYQVFLHVALVTLSILVVTLSAENRSMNSRGSASNADHLKVGDRFILEGLEPLVAATATYSNSTEQLVFLFSTRCRFCKENLSGWERLTKKVPRNQTIGISIDTKDSTDRYVALNGITFPVYMTLNSTAFKKSNKISAVPVTLLRTPTGFVRAVWIGKLDEMKLSEVIDSVSRGGGTYISTNNNGGAK